MPKVDAGIERANLAPKLRLEYLRERYASSELHSHSKLYERLRLRTDETKSLPAAKGLLALPKEMAEAIDPVGTLRNFGYLLETDVSKRDAGHYQPSQGLSKAMCEGLGWVIAASYEHWSRPPPKEDEPSKKENENKAFAEYIRGQGRAIAEYLLTGSPQPASIFLDAREESFSEISHESIATVASRAECKEFLRAARRPELKFVNAGASIARSVEATILDHIRTDPLRVVLLTSAAGDGKTTLLFRLASALFSEGWRVLFSAEWHKLPRFGAAFGKDGLRKTILFIDRAEDVPLDRLPDWMAANPQLRVVLAAREIDWRQRQTNKDGIRHRRIQLPRLSDENEITSLARLLVNYEAADDSVSVAELESRMRSSLSSAEHPHMLAAMMSASKNADFSSILETMIASFPSENILVWTALCSTAAVINPVLRMNLGLASALLTDRGNKLDDGRVKFRALLELVSSEIILVRNGHYDLRHPDIGKYVLSKIFGVGGDGSLLERNELEYRLDQISGAVIQLSRDTNNVWRNSVAQDFIDRFLDFWWSAPFVGGPELGRSLYKGVLQKFGNFKDDKKRGCILLHQWAILERDAKNIGKIDEPFSARWLFRQAFDLDSENIQVLTTWGILERDFGKPGSLDETFEPFSVRWLFKQAYQIDNNDLHTLGAWGIFERDSGNPGSFAEPFSARWLFRRAYGLPDNHLVLSGWSVLERDIGNIGIDAASEPFSCWGLISKLVKENPTRGEYWLRALQCNQLRAVPEDDREREGASLLQLALASAPKNQELWAIAVTRHVAADASKLNEVLEPALVALAPHQKTFLIMLAQKLRSVGNFMLAESILRPSVADLAECPHLETWLRYAVEAAEKAENLDPGLIEKAFDVALSVNASHPIAFLKAQYLAATDKMNDDPRNDKKGARSYFRESIRLGGAKSKIYEFWLRSELGYVTRESSPSEQADARQIFASSVAALGGNKSSVRARLLWGEFEAKLGNLGDEAQAGTGRFILRQCVSESGSRQQPLSRWIAIEKAYGDEAFVEKLESEGRIVFGENWRYSLSKDQQGMEVVEG